MPTTFTGRRTRINAALALLFSTMLVLPLMLVPTTAAAADEPDVIDDWCPDESGVSIVVDTQDLDPGSDPVVRCVTATPADGLDLIELAGFDLEEQMPGFVCRIDGAPDPDTFGDCMFDGYWSYWHADRGDDDWTYAQVGAGGRTPAPGTVDAWSFTVIVDGDWTGTPPRVAPQAIVEEPSTPPSIPGVPVPPRTPGDLDTRAATATAWLAAELEANDAALPGFGTQPDWGMTLDAVLALAAAGVGADIADDVVDRFAEDGGSFIGDGWVSAGGLGKALLTMQVVGREPVMQGRDLETELRAAMDENGRFGSINMFAHSIVILALARTDDGVPQVAVDYLLAQQCTEAGDGAGGFGWGSCTNTDPDYTALAVQALLALPEGTADEAIVDATGWLEARQAEDGSFAISAFNSTTPNSNSTGLGGQTLRTLGLNERAESASDYVGAIQVTCEVLEDSAFVEADLGTIAYSPTTFAESAEQGIATIQQDQYRRATTQALFAFGLPAFAELTMDGADAAIPERSCDEDPGDGDQGDDVDGDEGDGDDGDGDQGDGDQGDGDPGDDSSDDDGGSSDGDVGPGDDAPDDQGDGDSSADDAEGDDEVGSITPRLVDAIDTTLVPGQQVTVVLEGFLAGETVRFTLFSNPIELGTADADAARQVRFTFTVPEGLTPGEHTLRALGEESGRLLELAVTVDSPVEIEEPSTETSPSEAEPATSRPERVEVAGDRTMPRTGASVWLLVLAAVTLVSLGGVIIRRRPVDA